MFHHGCGAVFRVIKKLKNYDDAVNMSQGSDFYEAHHRAPRAGETAIQPLAESKKKNTRQEW